MSDKCKDWNRYKTSADSEFVGINIAAMKLAAKYAKYKITPFNYFEEAKKTVLNFASNELDYWCPNDPYKQGSIYDMIYQATPSKTDINLAPVQIVEAVESYCRFKLDSKKKEIEDAYNAASSKK